MFYRILAFGTLGLLFIRQSLKLVSAVKADDIDFIADSTVIPVGLYWIYSDTMSSIL